MPATLLISQELSNGGILCGLTLYIGCEPPILLTWLSTIIYPYSEQTCGIWSSWGGGVFRAIPDCRNWYGSHVYQVERSTTILYKSGIAVHLLLTQVKVLRHAPTLDDPSSVQSSELHSLTEGQGVCQQCWGPKPSQTMRRNHGCMPRIRMFFDVSALSIFSWTLCDLHYSPKLTVLLSRVPGAQFWWVKWQLPTESFSEAINNLCG